MRLRPATMEDAALLFDWRNDPAAVANTRAQRPVRQGEHRKWLQRALASPAYQIWIVLDEQQQPIGVGRLTRTADGLEVSPVIAAPFRHQGYGTALIRLLRQRALRQPIRPITALIRTANQPSIRAFWAAGFQIHAPAFVVMYGD